MKKKPKCPECNSPKVWRDGVRRTRYGDVQRWLCRDCGFRFSEPSKKRLVKLDVSRQLSSPSNSMDQLTKPLIGNRDLALKKALDKLSLTPSENEISQVESTRIPTVGKDLYTFHSNSRNRRISVPKTTGAKNLLRVGKRMEQQQAKSEERGKTNRDLKTLRGKIIEFMWYMKKSGYKPSAVEGYTEKIEKLVRKGANLFDPENVKKVIASVPTWNDGTKKIFTDVYDVFVRMEGLKWEKPRYTRIETLPFIPTGEELDQLICSCGRKLRVFLRGEKETGADPGELWAVEWKDIDMARKKLTINHPVKNHNPRILNVSDEWLRMVSRLPRTSERIWGTAKYGSLYSNLWQQRKRIAFQYDNPRLKKISFRTIRHWKGTMEYHLTHDLMHVKELLGHKTVQSTEIYIHLEEKLFEQLSSEFIVKRAVSVKGMLALASIGFEKFDEVDGIHLYRKPKTAE